MTRMHLALLPRDGFFCKDGRGWFTSGTGRGHSLEWPWPSTFLGALRTAWGRAEEERSGTRFNSSEWLARTKPIQIIRMVALRRPLGGEWTARQIVWPAPLDAVWFEDQPEVQRLDPRPPELPTMGRNDDAAREALWRPSQLRSDKPGKLPRWWRHQDLMAWLTLSSVPAPGKDGLSLARRVQAHVGIRDEELTADEGILFSHDVVETLEPQAEWAVGIEAFFPGNQLPAAATLGSDGRPVRIEPLPEGFFEPPEELATAFRAGSAGLRLLVVTPACFENGWLPDGLGLRDGEYRGSLAGAGEVVLRAAFVPRPAHISGWDMSATKPKSSSRMVAPGAVYFFERADGRAFTEVEARSLWLAAVGVRNEEGFGQVVPGVWNPARSNS